MRFFFALIVSFVICVSLFFGMNLMTSSDSIKVVKSSKTRQLNFFKEKTDIKVERKKRIKPEKQKQKLKEPIKKVKIKVNTKINTKIENVKIKPFKVQSKQIDISTVSSLSDVQVDVPKVKTPTLDTPQVQTTKQQTPQIYDASSLQVIRKIQPIYPRKARIRKKSGFVDLRFSINNNGFVSNVKVISSKPKGLFERSAINALKKWKFKRTEASKVATITFNFRLQR